jgi:hypothetical protein
MAISPPDEEFLGRPSYEVCSRCEFEFGNDDNPATAEPDSFESYRAERELCEAPPSGTFECYIRGSLGFAGVTELEWVEQGTPPAVDASGGVDYGHIDSMSRDGTSFELDGGWGRMRLCAETAMITLVGKALS